MFGLSTNCDFIAASIYSAGGLFHSVIAWMLLLSAYSADGLSHSVGARMEFKTDNIFEVG